MTESVLLIHVPKSHDGVNEAMYAPAGLFSIGAALDDAGFAAQIVHLGIESMIDPAFSLPKLIADVAPVAMLLDLHWHQQTAAVLGTAYQIRQRFADLPIVLGGLTASVFPGEIISRLAFVDVVVRGDAELPCVELLRALGAGRPLDGVPNVTFRREGKAVCAPSRFFTGARALPAGLARLDLMRNAPTYVATELYGDFDPSGGERLGPAFCYNPGRGCTARCVYCGGAAAAQTLTSFRKGAYFYPSKQVVADLSTLANHGVHTLRTSFDPEPGRPQMLELFARIREGGPRLRMVFDLWSLPSDELLDSFAATFAPDSTLVFSPESGSAEVRRRARNSSFSNDDLLAAITAMRARDIGVHLFFTAGLPFEGKDELAKTAALITRIRQTTDAHMSVAALEIDPGSAMHRHPERFGITVFHNSLQDFYAAHKGPSRPGFRTEALSEADILDAVEQLRAAGRADPV